jgi:hypothetical protein
MTSPRFASFTGCQLSAVSYQPESQAIQLPAIVSYQLSAVSSQP